jgi:putative ABC transport system substrate-binding protein
MASDLIGKQLELLKELVPKVARVALLWNPDNPGSAPQLRQAETAARALGVQLQPLTARVPQEIDSAFAAMTGELADAVLIFADGLFTNQRRQIAELAAQRRLPSVYGVGEYAEAGGLMTYSANYLDLERRAATFVDKILKGAKPADLPVEQPTKFDLIINLKTAKALGLTVPSGILLQATEVIQSGCGAHRGQAPMTRGLGRTLMRSPVVKRQTTPESGLVAFFRRTGLGAITLWRCVLT